MKRTISLLSTTLTATLFLSAANTPAIFAETTSSSPVRTMQDADHDGLLDINEVEILSAETSDTDHDGIEDGEEDADRDGLKNALEQKLGTNLDAADTDYDGLSDNDEVNQYSTNPLRSDTDADMLDDGTEILLKLDPFTADADGDGKLDGDVVRTYSIPDNEFSITGTVTGKSDVPKRVMFRKTPNLLVQQLESAQTFELISFDPNLTYNLKVPYQADTEKDDFEIFRYDKDMAKLVRVDKQKLDKKSHSIDVEVHGGGTFVVFSKEIWKKSLRPNLTKIEKVKKFNGKAKVHGLPSFELDAAQVDADGIFQISKQEIVMETAKSLDTPLIQGFKGGQQVTYTSKYQVKEVYTAEDGSTYVEAMAVSPESGKTPTILVHGLNGGPGTWGFTTLWNNAGSTAVANYNVPYYQTYTGSTYSMNSGQPYSNIDVSYPTGVADSSELGPVLLNSYGYTLHDDLFIFAYYAPLYDNTVVNAAYHLSGFISNMKAKKSYIYQFNLVGHSMGGLVSRYLVENLNSSSVQRVVTLGTPHFGSLRAVGGELDREDSQLWGSTSTKLQNDAYIPYVAFGGWNPSYSTLVANGKDIRGFYATSLGVPHTNSSGINISSWDAYIRNSYKGQMGYSTTANLNDTWVAMDSALGSDRDPNYNYGMAPVKQNKRFLIWHEVYGQHSDMRKYNHLQTYLSYSLNGLYDSETKD